MSEYVGTYDDYEAAAGAAAKRQGELREKRLEVATRDSLKKAYVRILLQELIVATGYYDQAPRDPYLAQRWAGKRDMALWLREKIGSIDFQTLSRMEQELAVEIPDPRSQQVEDD